MNIEATTVAPQTRQMLVEAAALTSGQGEDWLGRVMMKDRFMAAAQDYLNRAGLQRVEYSILVRFAAALERTLFTWRGPELAERLEAQLLRWSSTGLDGIRTQKLAVYCWEWAKEAGGVHAANGDMTQSRPRHWDRVPGSEGNQEQDNEHKEAQTTTR